MSDVSAVVDVPVICGPTAAGKSDLALALAERYRRPILVADSRQVYRGFDIGTAKPTAEEQQRVRHFAIDVAEPTARFSAAQWVALADDCLTSGNRPIVVGGTGLYLRALFEGLFDEPEHDEQRRADLTTWLETLSTEELRRWVEELDPARAPLGRTQLLRAIEVALLTGARISELHVSRATMPRWRPWYLVVDPGETLHSRIAGRLDSMIGAGWLEEVRGLLSIPAGAPAWKASGYRAMRAVAEGSLTLDEARERILIETRQYAKRQRTWFRHQLPEERTIRLDPRGATAEQKAGAWMRAMMLL